MATQTTAVTHSTPAAVAAQSADKQFLKRMDLALTAAKDKIGLVLPKHMKAERVMRVAMMAIYKTPRLRLCEPDTIVAAVMQASELGLEPGGPLGHGYLIPRKNGKRSRELRRDVYECQFQPGYQGLVDLARRSGQVAALYARVVHEKDPVWVIKYGTEDKLEHEPYQGQDDPGKMISVYAVCILKDSPRAQFDVMARGDVERIRGRSQSPNEGPWVTDYEEMAKKTVLKRLLKMLPKSVEMADAIDLDTSEYEVVQDGPAAIETGTARHADELRGRLSALTNGDTVTGPTPEATAAEVTALALQDVEFTAALPPEEQARPTIQSIREAFEHAGYKVPGDNDAAVESYLKTWEAEFLRRQPKPVETGAAAQPDVEETKGGKRGR